MKLVSGTPPWERTLPNPQAYPKLDEDITCDCLIVGGGMGGALLAHRLSSTGARTVLIDKRRIGGGSTQANTGLLQTFNDKSLTSCIHSFGEDQAVQFYRMCREAVHAIIRLGKEMEADLEVLPRHSLYYAGTEQEAGLLREEYANLRKHGFEVEWWEPERISEAFPFSKPGALYSPGDAEINPYRAVHALVAEAAARGVRVFEHTKAVRYEHTPHEVVCHTPGGRITAKQVVFAMGYETQELKKDRGAVLVNTYAVMTRPLVRLPEWPDRCLIWETARPYSYFRTTPDRRIIAGGRDEALTDSGRRETRVLSQGRSLLEDIRRLFPGTEELELEYAWGGVFGTTHDGLPFIGPHPDYPRCYFIEGYGGNGTVYSMIAAELLADAVQGIERPELSLFSLTRSPKTPPASGSSG
ncbi:NAD(P)/FAD-dependent oxidoreductase [Paenibacillus sp. CN-4]|uniref:NAD(P)/FAD-dependent oxidoreductase n=1 Tax=Paenibacillus nanchangensis TaxID=3348343 RepID=UPI00397BEA27